MFRSYNKKQFLYETSSVAPGGILTHVAHILCECPNH